MSRSRFHIFSRLCGRACATVVDIFPPFPQILFRLEKLGSCNKSCMWKSATTVCPQRSSADPDPVDALHGQMSRFSTYPQAMERNNPEAHIQRTRFCSLPSRLWSPAHVLRRRARSFPSLHWSSRRDLRQHTSIMDRHLPSSARDTEKSQAKSSVIRYKMGKQERHPVHRISRLPSTFARFRLAWPQNNLIQRVTILTGRRGSPQAFPYTFVTLLAATV